MIYLDYSANTPVDPRVLEVYCRTEQNFIGNPNSTHCAGQAARLGMWGGISSPPRWSIPAWGQH